MKLHWKQIGLGVLADIGISLIVGIIVGIVGAVVLAMQGVPETQIEARLMTGTLYLTFSLMLGLIASLIGGYIAAGASATKSAANKNVLAFGIIIVFLGILFQAALRQDMPLWYQIISYLSITPVAFLGGLWRWRNLQRADRVLDVAPSPLPEVPRK